MRRSSGNKINDYWTEQYNEQNISGETRKDLVSRGIKRSRGQVITDYTKSKFGKILLVVIGLFFIGLPAYFLGKHIYNVIRSNQDTIITVSYETFGGTLYNPIEFEVGDTFPLLFYRPEKEGHQFMGWYLDADFTESVNASFLNDFYVEDVTLYARFVSSDTEVNLSFDTMGGSALEDVTLHVGDSLNTYLPTKDNLYFAGWYEDQDYLNIVTHADTHHSTLYAKWSRYPMVTIGDARTQYYITAPPYHYKSFAVDGGIQMSRYEVNYELWYQIRTWAMNNGYTFAHEGKAGSMGTIGANPMSLGDQPVTNISWLDAIVWLNAYSEYEDLTPIYVNENNEVIKEANLTASVMESIKVREANGYRLPTMFEWMMAARWVNQTEYRSDFALFGGRYWLDPETYAGQLSDGDMYRNQVSWNLYNSNNQTHEIGLKTPNGLGMYDLSGNVMEMVYDALGDDFSKRLSFGGSYRNADFITWLFDQPYDAANTQTGFRIASGKIATYEYKPPTSA